jgi:hypothetical protein
MIALLSFLLTLLVSSFKSKSRLEAENAALRVLRRKVCGRVQLTNGDRLFLVLLYRWFSSVRALASGRLPPVLALDQERRVSVPMSRPLRCAIGEKA